MERLTYKFPTLSLANFAANAVRKDGVGNVVNAQNGFVTVETTNAAAVKAIAESVRGYEVLREAVAAPAGLPARPISAVTARLVTHKVPMAFIKQYPSLKKKKEASPGSKIMWSKDDNDLDVIVAKDVPSYVKNGWVIIEKFNEETMEVEVLDLTEKVKLTPDQLKKIRPGIKKDTKKEEIEEEEEEELVTEIQTPERAKEMKKMLAAAYKKQQADLQKAFKAGANEGDPIINKIDREMHKLDRLDDKEKDAKTKLFGKGGKIVKEEFEEIAEQFGTDGTFGTARFDGESATVPVFFVTLNHKQYAAYGAKENAGSWTLHPVLNTEDKNLVIAKEAIAQDISAKNLFNRLYSGLIGLREGVEVNEAFIRQQQWATMRTKVTRGTPVNIVLKNGKTVSGELLRMDKYDRGTADQGYMLWVRTSGGNVRVEDVDVKSVYWDNDPKTKMSEETEVSEAKKTKYLSGPGKKDSKRLIGIYTMGGKWVKDMGSEREAAAFVNKNWGEEVEQVDEAKPLVGGQKKLDVNKNGKLDAHDFKVLRAKKAAKEETEVNEAAPAIKAGMRLYAKQDKKTDNGSVVKGQYYKVADAGGGLFNLIHQAIGYRKAMVKVTASAIQAMIQDKIF